MVLSGGKRTMPADLLIHLGDRIRKLRKKDGWTQVEFAERVRIDRSFLADVERGKRNNFDFKSGTSCQGPQGVTLSKLLARL